MADVTLSFRTKAKGLTTLRVVAWIVGRVPMPRRLALAVSLWAIRRVSIELFTDSGYTLTTFQLSDHFRIEGKD